MKGVSGVSESVSQNMTERKKKSVQYAYSYMYDLSYSEQVYWILTFVIVAKGNEGIQNAEDDTWLHLSVIVQLT